ncbi:MAG: hypothetical protein ACOYZ8_06825 [Chloroflexota bacterium]
MAKLRINPNFLPGEFGITSLTRQKATLLTLLDIRCAHRRIETGLHYRHAVALKEDTTRMTVRNAAPITASINNLVLALIRQPKFHNAAQADVGFSHTVTTHLPFSPPPPSDFENAVFLFRKNAGQSHLNFDAHIWTELIQFRLADKIRKPTFGQMKGLSESLPIYPIVHTARCDCPAQKTLTFSITII